MMENSEIQEKIKWNIILNEVYEEAKRPSPSRITPFSFKNLRLTRQQLQQLKSVNQTAYDPPKVDCLEGKKIQVTGTLIKTSNLGNIFDCDGNEPEHIEIFAADTILFDQNLDMRGFYGLVSMVAPTWTIQDQKEINLDANSPDIVVPSKADKVQIEGEEGFDGIPGNPGNTAGSFFGLGLTFNGGENLKISASGSDGSKGQDGGDGGDGRRGADASVKNHLYDCYKNVFKWHCAGEEGQPGGKGGNGGVGGYGGYAGEIKFINLGNVSTPNNYVLKDGSQGPPGSGGAGGNGGIQGDTWQGVYILAWSQIKKESSGTKVAASGDSGTSGGNDKGIKNPAAPIKIEVEGVINDYRNFLQGSLEDDFIREQGYQFLLLLMQSEVFNQFYTTKGIIQEFIHLEEHFYKLNEKIDYIPIYKALLPQITANPPINDENKKVLAYLYTTTLSKICALQEQTNKNFITDLKTFLDICVSSIKELEESQTGVTINEYTTVYEDQIDSEITEAKQLLDEHITPKIQEATANIDKKIKELFVEIFELQRQAEKYQIELLEAKREMSNNIGWQIFGKVLDGVGGLLSFMGPLGNIASTCTSVGSQVADYFTGKNNEVMQGISGFDDLKNQFAAIANSGKAEVQEEIVEFVLNLTKITELITPEVTELTWVVDDIEEINKKLNAFNGSENELLELYVAELNNLKAKLDGTPEFRAELGIITDAGRVLIAENTTNEVDPSVPTEAPPILTKAPIPTEVLPDETDPPIPTEVPPEPAPATVNTTPGGLPHKNIITKIKNKIGGSIQKAMDLGSLITKTSIGFYNTIKDDQQKIDTISEMIEENAEMIENIKEYKKRVQDTLQPMLEQMAITLQEIENGLENESTVRLEVTKWETQDTLNNIKEILQEYTQGFTVQSELTKSIDTITDTINKMITIYEKIQDFQNQKKLYDYMAAINSATYTNIPVQDPELQSALNTLDLYMKSNILLQKYRQSITQIKQFAFPLAETYFKQMDLPQALQAQDSIEGYTQNAINQIEKFQTKLADSTMYVLKYDDIKHRSKFYENLPAGPFFVWKNETFHQSISKLLSGEEVVFYANPNQQNKTGVKFSLIDIRLKAGIIKYQSQLDEILKNFEVSLTHMGNNYYNCNNKTYLVSTMSQRFQFDFQKFDDDYADFDIVFDKIHKGNFLLSPYTTWKIQLLGSEDDFNTLKAYGEDSDLQLVGEGEFFENDPSLCSQNLEDYYEMQSVIQKKEAKCVKVLTSGLFDKNDECLLYFNQKSGFYNPYQHINSRSIGDDIPYYTNSYTSYSSPINNFFKWFSQKIKFLSHDSSNSNLWNPELAFNQVNSLLILAPILLHFTSESKEEEKKSHTEVKFVEVENLRKEVWVNFLDYFQELLVKFNIKEKWIIMNLQDRREEMDSITQPAKEEDITKLEMNLITLWADFLDDVKYDDVFIGVRTTKTFKNEVKKLGTKLEEIPNFGNIFQSVKCKYC